LPLRRPPKRSRVHVQRWMRQETAARYRSHGKRKLENFPPRSGGVYVGSVQLQRPAAGIPRCFFPLEVVAEKCVNFNELARSTAVLAVGRPGILPGSLSL